MQSINLLNLQSDTQYSGSDYDNSLNTNDDQFVNILGDQLSAQNEPVTTSSNTHQESAQESATPAPKDSIKDTPTPTDISDTNTNDIPVIKSAKATASTKKTNDIPVIASAEATISTKSTKEISAKSRPIETVKKIINKTLDSKDKKGLTAVYELLEKIQELITKIQIPEGSKLTAPNKLRKSLANIRQVLEAITDKHGKLFSKTDIKTLKNLSSNLNELLSELEPADLDNTDFAILLENLEDTAKSSTQENKQAIKIDSSANTSVRQKIEATKSTKIKEQSKEISNELKTSPKLSIGEKKEIITDIKKMTDPIIKQVNELLANLEGEVKQNTKKATNQGDVKSIKSNTSIHKLIHNFNRIEINTEEANSIEIITAKTKANKKELDLKSILNKSEEKPSTELFLKTDKSPFSLKNEFLANFFKIEADSDLNTQELKMSATQMDRIEQIEKQVQVVKQVRSFISLQKLNAETELTLKLNPKTLGEIKIQITKQEQVDSHNTSLIVAKFQVESETVKAILESNLNELKDMLSENSNLALAEFSVEVNDENKKDNFSNFFKKKETSEFSLDFDDGLEAPVELMEDQHAGALNSVA